MRVYHNKILLFKMSSRKCCSSKYSLSLSSKIFVDIMYVSTDFYIVYSHLVPQLRDPDLSLTRSYPCCFARNLL